MKNSICCIFILLTCISSCRKEKPIDHGVASVIEKFPPGWHAYKTSYEVSFSGIILNHADDIWCYSSKHLYKMTGANFTDHSRAISRYLTFNSTISAVAIDKNDRVWVAVDQDNEPSSAGLIKYDGTTIETYNLINSGIHNNNVMNVVIDSKDVKWLGTTNSLVKYDGSTWSYYDSLNSPLREYYPLISAFDAIWITGHHSLKKIDGTSVVNWDASNSSFPSSGMRLVNKDKLGNLWFMGYSDTLNLWKFDGATFSSFVIPAQYKPSDKSEFAMIKIDPFNNVWLGGTGRLLKFNGTNWIDYPAPFYTVSGGDPRLPHPKGPVQAKFLGMVIKNDSSKWLLEKNFGNKSIMTFQE